MSKIKGLWAFLTEEVVEQKPDDIDDKIDVDQPSTSNKYWAAAVIVMLVALVAGIAFGIWWVQVNTAEYNAEYTELRNGREDHDHLKVSMGQANIIAGIVADARCEDQASCVLTWSESTRTCYLRKGREREEAEAKMRGKGSEDQPLIFKGEALKRLKRPL